MYIYIFALAIRHKNRIFYMPFYHLLPVWLYRIFPHYLTKDTIFFRKTVITLKMYVRFSRVLSFETCLTLRKIQREVIRNVR